MSCDNCARLAAALLELRQIHDETWNDDHHCVWCGIEAGDDEHGASCPYPIIEGALASSPADTGGEPVTWPCHDCGKRNPEGYVRCPERCTPAAQPSAEGWPGVICAYCNAIMPASHRGEHRKTCKQPSAEAWECDKCRCLNDPAYDTCQWEGGCDGKRGSAEAQGAAECPVTGDVPAGGKHCYHSADAGAGAPEMRLWMCCKCEHTVIGDKPGRTPTEVPKAPLCDMCKIPARQVRGRWRCLACGKATEAPKDEER